MTTISEEDYLAHYGILRKSGRYPWGSGDNVEQRSRTFLDYIKEMLGLGMTEAEIARGLSTEDEPFTTTDLRAARAIARNEAKQADINMAQRLKDKGLSNGAIAERMGISGESQVRALLKPGEADKLDVLHTTSQMLRDQVDSKGLIQVGTGVENHVGISRTKLDTAIAMLKEDGYRVHNVKVDQLGTGKQTEVKVLTPPGTTQKDAWMRRGEIQMIGEYSDNGGRDFIKIEPPTAIDSKRVGINYAEDGGTEADGVIYVRPGVDDISLGASQYAQVRIAVDGTHYLKGMAIYKTDLPDGVDLVFNTNKSDKGDKLKAMKPMKTDADGNIDTENPFGAVIDRQHGVMNVIREEGTWDTWSRTLSSQMLSKQTHKLVKEQLDMTYENKLAEFEEISSLTNPAVKRKLLESYADGVDAAAVHLKAAQLPRMSNHVILPVSQMKDTEIYAPNFKNGERVALVRYPHGGIFEIPELTVNNNQPDAKKLLGPRPKDAVGINSRVAERLSGADFDGDHVLVIPNNSGKIRSAPALEGLKNFDPKGSFPAYDGMKTLDGGRWNAKTEQVEFPPGKKPSSRGTQLQMGDISNLITDMTIRGATENEIARAVRHSMVVIDAEKHHLDYKQSAIDNGIHALKSKYQAPYQASGRGGASTIISRATSDKYVLDRKPRSAAKGGPIDKKTGALVYEYTGRTRKDKKGNVVPKEIKSTKLAEATDAHTLSSGTPTEKAYADHSNKLKALANRARLEYVNTENTPYSPSAKAAYSNEVASLNASLNVALKNRPLERQAQILANAVYAEKKRANPHLEQEDLKKIKSRALIEARHRTGAEKQQVQISEKEWQAIQAGAISNHKLDQILQNTDLDRVKELAMPKQKILMTGVKTQRAQSMAAAGYTQAEIASALGVSLTTLKTALA